MIVFKLGDGAQQVEGFYTLDDGVEITTDRPPLDGLGEILGEEIEYRYAAIAPWLGRYAACEYVIVQQWGGTITAKDIPTPAGIVEY